MALTRGQKPSQQGERDGRQVEVGEVSSPRLSDTYTDPVRVVKARERWTERQRMGQEWLPLEKEQHWL